MEMEMTATEVEEQLWSKVKHSVNNCSPKGLRLVV